MTTSTHDLPTPALVLDIGKLERNIERMATRAKLLGVKLRPHVKTHKCIEIAEMQRRAGGAGITVSTLTEARLFAERGFDDITWAFPIPLGQIEAAARLAETVALGVLVDCAEAIAALEAGGRPFRVWLKVDCGYHRAGIDPERPESLDLVGRLAESATLDLAGILTHAGHSYGARSREELAVIAAQERDVMVRFGAALEAAGIAVPEISIGSTPTMSVAERLEGITEIRPGNYVFYDHTQSVLGSCEVADCAVTVETSVVSSRPEAGRSIVDAGALALSKDSGPGWADPATMGEIFADYPSGALDPDLRVLSVTQEHGIVSQALPVGTRVRILPNHSCLTAAQFDEYSVVRGDAVQHRWPILRQR